MEDVMGADAPDDIGFTIMEVEAIDASAEHQPRREHSKNCWDKSKNGPAAGAGNCSEEIAIHGTFT